MQQTKAYKFTILDELEDFIVSLSTEEFVQLESSIIKEGCRDPLIVWKREKDNVLIDGHHRFRICKKNNISFDVSLVNFESIDDVKLWMLNNQIGRRNLSPDQLSYYRGLKYISLRNKKGGYDNVLSKGQNEPSTSELLSHDFKISESTIKRDAKYAEGLNLIAKSNPTLKNKILKGEVKVKKGDIQILTQAPNKSELIIKNEADLFNKAQQIKNRILTDIENDVEKINKIKTEEAQKVIAENEPLFLEKGDRLRKIKGMIISAINRAINNRDTKAIEELKKLIERLENVILEE